MSWKVTGNVRDVFQIIPRNVALDLSDEIPGKFSEISGKCPGNVHGIFQIFPRNVREDFGKFPGSIWVMSRKFLGNVREMSRTVPGNVRECPGYSQQNKNSIIILNMHIWG